jgi:deoxyadenosine/deoxycytidine kinase
LSGNVASPIIVEGPDGAGKTTLAKRVAEHYQLEYRRPPDSVLSSSSGPLSGELVEWWESQLARAPDELATTVYDRCFYISDPIYQQAVPDRDLMIHPHSLALGIMRLWNTEPYLIFCLPEFATILTNVRVAGRDHLDITAEALSKIWNQYHAYHAMWSQSLYENVIKYNYEEEDAWDRLIDHLAAVA